jgi:hypothetical protein
MSDEGKNAGGENKESQKSGPKIDLTVGLFVGIIMVIADLIDLIPLAGDLVDICIGAPLQLWLFFEGIRGTFVFIGNIVEAIPILQEFPLTRTITWGVTWFIDNNPKLEKVTELAGGAMGGGEVGATAKEVGAVAKETEAVTEAGAEAANVTAKTSEELAAESGGISAAGGVAETNGEGGAAARNMTEEGAEEKTEENLKDKAKRKIREHVEEGFGGGEEGKEKEAEEESEEETAEEAEMFGMPETPEQELEKQLFPETPPTSSVQSISETPRNVQPPKPRRNGGDNVVSIDELKRLKEASRKGEALRKQWESARDDDGSGDVAKAA